MENNLEKTSAEIKKRNPFWMGVIITTVFFGLLFVSYNYFENKKAEEEKITQEKAKKAQELIQKQRAGIVADSIRIVNQNKEKYKNMVNLIVSRDSIRKTLRYRIGDVVYLKPDSIRCVIMDVTSDSTLSAYSYTLISNNKNNDPGILIRNDKLIY